MYDVCLQEIVALSGAHTLGRARPERSGWGKPETKYTVCYSHCFAPRLLLKIQNIYKNINTFFAFFWCCSGLSLCLSCFSSSPFPDFFLYPSVAPSYPFPFIALFHLLCTAVLEPSRSAVANQHWFFIKIDKPQRNSFSGMRSFSSVCMIYLFCSLLVIKNLKACEFIRI